MSARPAAAPRPDPFGYDPEFHARVSPFFEVLYRRYWRVQTDGLKHIPDSGPAIIVANHSGGIPFDATMIGSAINLEHPQRRLVRFLYDRFVASMPYMGEFYNRLGSAVASFENARRLLERGDLVGMFPEGVAGVAKGIWRSYQLQPFHSGFVRLSLLLRVPIIPAAVVGAEEIYPVIGKVPSPERLRHILSIPYLPVTPFFPLLGLLGMIPLPTKWHIRFAAPIRLYEDKRWRHVRNTRQAGVLAERVRRRIQAMVNTLLAERQSIF